MAARTWFLYWREGKAEPGPCRPSWTYYTHYVMTWCPLSAHVIMITCTSCGHDAPPPLGSQMYLCTMHDYGSVRTESPSLSQRGSPQ